MVDQNMLRTYQVKYIFSDKKIEFDYSVDVTKCLHQIEIPDLLHMSAPCSKLPSNISTMVQGVHVVHTTGKVVYQTGQTPYVNVIVWQLYASDLK